MPAEGDGWMSNAKIMPGKGSSDAETEPTWAAATAPQPPRSIFRSYFHQGPFCDRYVQDAAAGVDVLIPVLHTNDLWEANLLSIYREIPVKRLLLGNAGCIDRTLDVAAKFPRVEVFDHRAYVSLGYSIRKLIEEVQSDWFVYLHSDVYLPPGWFDTMKKFQGQYDWYECKQHLTILLEYPKPNRHHPTSGSQMGRKAAFADVLPKIDDDYLYRNEDIIIAHLIEEAGKRYGRVDETYHYHQHMLKRSTWGRDVRVEYSVEPTRKEEIRTCLMQAKGIVKYMNPTLHLVDEVMLNVKRLQELGVLTQREFGRWATETNPTWRGYPQCRLRLWDRLRLIKRSLKELVKAAVHCCHALYRLVRG
jgi:hypothetical protein